MSSDIERQLIASDEAAFPNDERQRVLVYGQRIPVPMACCQEHLVQAINERALEAGARHQHVRILIFNCNFVTVDGTADWTAFDNTIADAIRKQTAS